MSHCCRRRCCNPCRKRRVRVRRRVRRGISPILILAVLFLLAARNLTGNNNVNTNIIKLNSDTEDDYEDLAYDCDCKCDC